MHGKPIAMPPSAECAAGERASQKLEGGVLIMSFRTRSRQIVATVLLAVLANSAHGADRIRVAAQITGTLGWELEVIRAHKLDRDANLDIETIQLASTEAGQIRLRGGPAHLLGSDWLWVP